MKPLSGLEQLVFRSLQHSSELKCELLRDQDLHCLVANVGLLMAAAVRKGNKLFFFGNGGSAADAQHLAAELTGRFLRDRPGVPGVALTVNSASLTAIANDYSYEYVFARQLQAFGSSGDIAVGISTSGNSANVIRALEVGREAGLLTVALTGRNGGKMRKAVDYCICVPSDDTPRIQEAHILIGHILCEIIEEELFPPEQMRARQTNVF